MESAASEAFRTGSRAGPAGGADGQAPRGGSLRGDVTEASRALQVAAADAPAAPRLPSQCVGSRDGVIEPFSVTQAAAGGASDPDVGAAYLAWFTSEHGAATDGLGEEE
eukprot:14187127-Alexandrium_andersonii.AAC.1